MSTHTFQAQGRRSTVALPERTEAHRECRPGAKSKHISPYARGKKVIGNADGEAHQHPGTSMFQKGLPQNLRVPSEPVPQTLGFSILESGYRFFRRSFSSRYPIMGHISKKSRLSLQCKSKIKNSYFRAGQQITYSRFQLIQVIFTGQTYESCHPLTCKARILNLPRSIDLNKPQAWEYPLDPCLSRGNQISSREHITYNAKVLPVELTLSLSSRENITYNARYCLRSLHAYSQAASERHNAKSEQVPGVVLPRKAEYGPCKIKYSGFLRTPGLNITSGLLDQNPRVIKNLRVPMQSPGPEKISGPGKDKTPCSSITLGSKQPPGLEEPLGSKRLSGLEKPLGSKRTPGLEEPPGLEKPPGSKRPPGLEQTPGSKRPPGLEEPPGLE
ncbi:hypothetical protein F2Q69_00030623 [Brassica cretica]|uniref:Uncharacterized protein n=1 Tax=Brassica cretica TaxID=69181 RepID=A0A8S9S2Z4_BRACR|nr:hypothetical protein F2Q69_00030623 [Brassica cretica]